MTPRPSGSGADEVGDIELRLAEELGAAAGLEPDEAAQEHPDGRRGEPADPLELRLAGVRLEEREERAQVGQVEEGEALLVGVVEDEREALLLGLVRLEDLGEQLRAEVGDGCAHRDARPDAAERQVLDRVATRLEGQPELTHPLLRGATRLAWLGEPGHVALHISGEDGDPRVG